MAIVFLQQEKTQKFLLLVFAGIILITAIVVWGGFSKKEKIVSIEKALGEKKEVIIDLEVLKNPLLKELQPFSEIEPFQAAPPAEVPPAEGRKEEKLGRENPFIPY